MNIYRFKEFILFEGGKVFGSTTRRINRNEIPSIEARLLPVLKAKDYKNLGSAGNKPTSGDIDIGIKDFEPSQQKYDALKEAFPNYEIKWSKGLSLISIAWPIEGKEGGDFVQVDIIPIKHLDWTEFVYKFPKDSEYTSSHRNWLIAAICSVLTDVTSRDLEGNVHTFNGYMFKLNDGFFEQKRSYKGKNGLLKNSYKVSEKKITSDPREMVKFLFGKEIELEDVETLEQCLNIIKRPGYKWSKNLSKIKQQYREFLNRQGLKIPSEL